MSLRVPEFALVLSFACFFASNASAEDSATAGALFEKGVAEMQAGHFESACPAIEESQRIEPRPGTLFTLAECHAHWGKIATASARYQEYVDLVSQLTPEQQQRHKARAEIARAQLVKLRPLVPTLTLALPKDAPAGVSVTRNGQALSAAALGLSLPVDPGDYVIVTRVPGAPDREARVSLQLGESKTVQLEAQASAAPAVNGPAPLAPERATEHELQTPKAAADQTRARKTAAYVVGGVGVAGVVLGSVTGLSVLSKKSKVTDGCTGAACNQTGLDAANSAKSLATISDIGFGLGVAGLAASAILLLTGGSEEPAQHARSPRTQALFVSERSGFVAGLRQAF